MKTLNDIQNLDDFLQLENIDCIDSKGNAFEHYDRLLVRKDIERDSNDPDNRTNSVRLTPYRATVHFESQGLFLPSFALTCNILAALYHNECGPEGKKVVSQYNTTSDANPWHVQNTLADWGAKRIIHYPNREDYISAGGPTNINQQRVRTVFSFKKNGFLGKDIASYKETHLEELLKIPDYKRFIQDLTGLQEPEYLVHMGWNFRKTALSWPETRERNTKATWLGSSMPGAFFIGTSENLDAGKIVRGVRYVQ